MINYYNEICSFINKWGTSQKKDSQIRENPATRKPIEDVSLCTKEEVDKASSYALKSFADWSKTPGSIRSGILYKISDMIKQKSEYLANINSSETGKPIRESLIVEINGTARTFEYYAGLASRIQGNTQSLNENLLSMTIKEPIGVVGQILPWNFPLLLASWKMAPALASGCAMVIKPSELTPLGTLELARICEESGVPPGVINVCQGVGEICGDAIVKNLTLAKFLFTGSTLVGKQIVKNSAENLSRVSLELGGKAPNIVFEDAN